MSLATAFITEVAINALFFKCYFSYYSVTCVHASMQQMRRYPFSSEHKLHIVSQWMVNDYSRVVTCFKAVFQQCSEPHCNVTIDTVWHWPVTTDQWPLTTNSKDKTNVNWQWTLCGSHHLPFSALLTASELRGDDRNFQLPVWQQQEEKQLVFQPAVRHNTQYHRCSTDVPFCSTGSCFSVSIGQ